MAGDDNKNETRGRLSVRKRPAPAAAPARIEPVLGDGPVRRIVFEEERTFRPVEVTSEPEPEPEPAPQPEPEPQAPPQQDRLSSLPPRRRGNWDIETIHREVDRMHRNRTWGRIEFGIDQPGTIYRTTRGAVRESSGLDQQKRLLYVSEGEGSSRRESRFISTLVDRVIAGVDGPTPSERQIARSLGRGDGRGGRTEVYERTVIRETRSGGARPGGRSSWTNETGEGEEQDDSETRASTNGHGVHGASSRRSRTTVEESVESFRSTSRSKSRSGGAEADADAEDTDSIPRLSETKPKAKATGASASSKKKSGDAPAKPGQDRSYQEQCVALTNDGVQCRNSSRQGSKYCASHRNYRARGSPAIRDKLDTLPAHPKAKDTKPAVRKK